MSALIAEERGVSKMLSLFFSFSIFFIWYFGYYLRGVRVDEFTYPDWFTILTILFFGGVTLVLLWDTFI